MTQLTIVFPVYNDHTFLNRALQALSDQTRKDFSVVLIDDQSPQEYDDLLQKWTPYLDISLVRNQKNLGAMNNIWKSITYAVTTPFIMSHHSDDCLKSDYIENALSILEQNETISFVTTGPDWISKQWKYEVRPLENKNYTTFDAADFAKNVLQFAPYMFGSVIYRASDRLSEWKYDTFNVYCDRYFLGKILSDHNSCGAYLEGRGINEQIHDHTRDTRFNAVNTTHVIALFIFYKTLLSEKYDTQTVNKLTTNTLLYYWSNLPGKNPLFSFIQQQKKYSLLHFSSVRTLGVYSIFNSVLPSGLQLRFLKFFKKMKI